MDNKEKFINFIVDDLVKNTEIDSINGMVRMAIGDGGRLIPYPLTGLVTFEWRTPVINTNLLKTCTVKYGAKKEEIPIIWKLYRERILKSVYNESGL